VKRLILYPTAQVHVHFHQSQTIACIHSQAQCSHPQQEVVTHCLEDFHLYGIVFFEFNIRYKYFEYALKLTTDRNTLITKLVIAKLEFLYCQPI